MSVKFLKCEDPLSPQTQDALRLSRATCRSLLARCGEAKLVGQLQDAILSLTIRDENSGGVGPSTVIGALANYAMVLLLVEIEKEKQAESN